MRKTKQLNMKIWTARGAQKDHSNWQTHAGSYGRFHLSALKVSLKNILSTPLSTLLIVLAISIGLCIPASLYLAVKNLRSLSPAWSNQLHLTVMLDNSATVKQAEQLSAHFHKTPHFISAHIVPKEQALAEFQAQSGFNDLAELLPHNPLPHVVQLQFNVAIDTAELEQHKSWLEQQNSVDEVLFEQAWIEKLQGVIQLSESVFDSIALLVAIGITFVIGTLVRLTLESQREEVEVLHLLGATAQFIRRPFLYRGLWLGLLGGVLALFLIEGLSVSIENRANQVATLFEGLFVLKKFSIWDTLSLLGLSTALGWFGAWCAFAHNQRTFTQSIK
jgi:cell division transport system permease protein